MGFQEFFRYLAAELAGHGELPTRLERSSWLCGRESVIEHGTACSSSIRLRTRLTACVNVRYHENTLLMVGGKLVEDEKRDGYIWLEDAGRIAACDAAGRH